MEPAGRFRALNWSTTTPPHFSDRRLVGGEVTLGGFFSYGIFNLFARNSTTNGAMIKRRLRLDFVCYTIGYPPFTNDCTDLVAYNPHYFEPNGENCMLRLGSAALACPATRPARLIAERPNSLFKGWF